MPVSADGLQPHVVSSLISLGGRRGAASLADILMPDQRVGYDLDFDDESESISIDFRQTDLIGAALGSDCSRLACAALQSAASAAREITDRSNTAWSIVKLYYAAFYAGHALLRIVGESCTYFDRNNVNRIGELFRVIGRIPSFGVDSGLYHCILNPAATGISAKRARGAVGGAHEAFWKIFGDRISRLADEVLIGPLAPKDARQVSAKLTELTAILSRRGVSQHTWLSSVRNALQYQHKFDVWFPARMRTEERTALGRLSNQWTREAMNVDLGAGTSSSLREFVSACVFIVALCLEMVLWIAERSTVGSQSFARLGPIAFLQDAQLVRVQQNRIIIVSQRQANAEN